MAACWICLDEGPDENGSPLIRECSCRGDDAGFCHLRCVVNYAKKDGDKFDHGAMEQMKLWTTCPNCCQLYRNDLRVNLADALLSFTKETFPCDPRFAGQFPCDPYRYAKSLLVKMRALQVMYDDGVRKDLLGECKSITSKIMLLSGDIKRNVDLVQMYESWVIESVTNIEAVAYDSMGMFLVEDVVFGRAGRGVADTIVGYLEKAIDLYRSIGSTENARSTECNIAEVKHIFSVMGIKAKASAAIEPKEHLEFLRKQYKRNPNDKTGMNLASSLLAYNHNIEMQRLIEELVRDSRRVNGANHGITTMLEAYLEQSKVRKVRLFTRPKEESYHALRYEDEGVKCVVRGPILQQRMLENERTFTVDTNKVILQLGTPVICHGLKNAVHLNDKIGDIRNFRLNRYEVHFEDPSLKRCLVKTENVRVLFELPELQDES